jgi:hypothetical protein
MSHVVTIQTRAQDPVAIVAACKRLDLPEPRQGTAKLYSGEATGLIVQLPGWQYPAVIDTASGTIHYDNFEELWGEQRHLDRFLQVYAIERCRLEANAKGLTFREQQLQDGSVKLQIIEAST